MGTVSNVVFERILAAVHANNSADVLAILGRLLDAGNGPQPLARQFVRYLRNCPMAKITNLAPDQTAHGLAADLLQISPEERSRAARTAALFTEEELSRYLSILLRTFDDLGYRQEPRFHLELGVLKLVHLQRLLPVEDLLTQLGATKSPPTPSTTPTSLSSSTTPGAPSDRRLHRRDAWAPCPLPLQPCHLDRRPRRSPHSGFLSTGAHSAAVERPAFGTTTTPVILSERAARSRRTPRPSAHHNRLHLLDHHRLPRPRPRTLRTARARPPQLVEAVIDLAAAAEPQTNLDLDALQSSLVSALAAVKGQQSASDTLHDATLTLAPNASAPDTLEIQTTLSKPMLRHRLQRRCHPHPHRHAPPVAPEPRAHTPPRHTRPSAAPKKKRAAASGSATELAENHPMVKEAKRLFSAEISNVIDLRDKN